MRRRPDDSCISRHLLAGTTPWRDETMRAALYAIAAVAVMLSVSIYSEFVPKIQCYVAMRGGSGIRILRGCTILFSGVFRWFPPMCLALTDLPPFIPCHWSSSSHSKFIQNTYEYIGPYFLYKNLYYASTHRWIFFFNCMFNYLFALYTLLKFVLRTSNSGLRQRPSPAKNFGESLACKSIFLEKKGN